MKWVILVACLECPGDIPPRFELEYDTREQCVEALDALLTELELRMTFKVDETIPKQCYQK